MCKQIREYNNFLSELRWNYREMEIGYSFATMPYVSANLQYHFFFCVILQAYNVYGNVLIFGLLCLCWFARLFFLIAMLLFVCNPFSLLKSKIHSMHIFFWCLCNCCASRMTLIALYFTPFLFISLSRPGSHYCSAIYIVTYYSFVTYFVEINGFNPQIFSSLLL